MPLTTEEKDQNAALSKALVIAQFAAEELIQDGCAIKRIRFEDRTPEITLTGPPPGIVHKNIAISLISRTAIKKVCFVNSCSVTWWEDK